MVCPIPAQERPRGWSCGYSPFGRRPRANSRVRLTDGRMAHSSRHGDVLSSRVFTSSGRVLQCPGWQHSGRDGCTGPEVTAETHSTGLTSWRRPARAWEKCPYLFRGCGAPAVREQAAQCHGVDTGLTAQRRTVAGMAAQDRSLAQQRRGRIPRRCQRAGAAGIHP
jgi:hypothetical protein